MEDEPDNFRALRLTVILPPITSYQQRAAKNDAFLHAAHLSPFGAFRGPSAFVLCEGTHDRQPQLPIVGAGIQAVIQKQHADAAPTQLAGDLQSIHRVAGETADLLGHESGRSAPAPPHGAFC